MRGLGLFWPLSERGLRRGARARARVGGQPASEWEDAGDCPRKAWVSHRSRAGQAPSIRLPFTRSSSSLVNKEPWPSAKALDLSRVFGLLFKATPRPLDQGGLGRLGWLEGLAGKSVLRICVIPPLTHLGPSLPPCHQFVQPANLQTPTAASLEETSCNFPTWKRGETVIEKPRWLPGK